MTTNSADTSAAVNYLPSRKVLFEMRMVDPVMAAVKAYIKAVHDEWDPESLITQYREARNAADESRAEHVAAGRGNTPHRIMAARSERYAGSRILHLLTDERCRIFEQQLEDDLERAVGGDVDVKDGFIEPILLRLQNLAARIESSHEELISQPLSSSSFTSIAYRSDRQARETLIAALEAALS